MDKPKMPKGAKAPEAPTCQCGATMEPYESGNRAGWRCRACNRIRPIISDHMKPPR